MQKTSQEVLDCLNKIFQEEMSGVFRYLHYSFMIMGHNRIPIQKWFRDQAQESINHAIIIGEKITSYGGHPNHQASPIPDTQSHAIDKILEESMEFETQALSLYKELVQLAGDDIALEELARQMVREETEHLEEVQKMMRHSK
ncbi:MAG: bacterioferritin [Deltaproteobacteria bacterium]|nr:bacterioferritin [Deltaproteobacteria bacterium]